MGGRLVSLVCGERVSDRRESNCLVSLLPEEHQQVEGVFMVGGLGAVVVVVQVVRWFCYFTETMSGRMN